MYADGQASPMAVRVHRGRGSGTECGVTRTVLESVAKMWGRDRGRECSCMQ